MDDKKKAAEEARAELERMNYYGAELAEKLSDDEAIAARDKLGRDIVFIQTVFKYDVF